MHVLLASADEAAHAGAQHTVAPHAGLMDAAWLPAITSLIVFGLAFIFLYIKVWPKIVGGLDDRQRKIRQEIEAAEAARAQADAARAEYQQELASARQEASNMIARARSDAKAAGDDLKRRNEQELADLKQRATKELDAARQAAITELHAAAAVLASQIAGKILRREISPADQQRLVDESLEELAGARE